ncbi:MAG: manganese efflux pump, partial [Bacteroidales bacterium]|nr:manganese efflux pump [Bacteroidales bacterium]
MSFWDLLLIAIGLSMDAFAVSIGKGLSVRKATVGNALSCGLWFGGFQALMPLIGFLLIYFFTNIPAVQGAIEGCDHWVACLLLVFIGGNMLREAFCAEDESVDDSFSVRTMFTMAVATSIDALATGITFGCLERSENITSLLESSIWL